MQILQVNLENVKSYEHASVAFRTGTNAICGHNGAGKSTVLEAIGFALFDYLAVSQADFVREGEKSATVTITIADRDGRNYQVVRRCGSSSQHYVYDPELDQKLTDGKGETMAWLNELMGMDGNGDLAVLFRDAVGVPQGLLTAAFLDTPARRKDTFNPLLRVDDYERAWEGLREPARRIEQQIADLQVRIAGLAAQVEVLPELRKRAAHLRNEIERGTAEEAELTETQAETAADLAVLAERKERLDDLDQAVRQADVARQATQVRLDSAQAALAAAESAQAIVDATQDAHAAYLAAQRNRSDLEEARLTRDDLIADRQQTAQALAVVEERAARLVEAREAIEQAKATMAALTPDIASQEALEAQLKIAQRDADRLTATQGELDRENTRLAELRQRHSTAADQLAQREQVQVELAEAEASLTSKVARRQRLEADVAGVTLKKQQAERQIDAVTQRRDIAKRRLEQETARAAQIVAQLERVEAQLAELAETESAIQAARETLQALAEKRQDAVEAGANCEAALDQVERQMTLLATSEAPECPVCGEPLSDDRRAALLSENEARAAELRADRAETEEATTSLTVAVSDEETALAQLEARARKLPRPEEACTLAEQHTEQAARVTEAQDALAEEMDSLAAQRADLEALTSELAALHADLAAATQRAEAQQGVVHDLTEALQQLATADEVATLAENVAEQAARVSETEDNVASLAAAPSEVTRLTKALADLDDPRRTYDRAADIAAGEATTVAQLTAAEEEIDALQNRVAEIDAQLDAYADLDDQIAAVRNAMAETEADHQRYLQHEREAAAISERRDGVTQLTSELTEDEARYADRIAAYQELADDYDAGLHARLTDELGEIRAAIATLAERLRQQQAQLDETTAAIAKLEAVEETLTATRSELATEEEIASLLTYLRHVLREAGPQVTRALVQMISLHADRLYADIMQTYRSRLRWTEDYDIVLSTEGRDRTFQQLSGGEQMAAGLAVRLALLREVSTIDVAFFDEPTANLDGARRANLAQQILNIKGFSQLFVISHDDTFEQDTDHVVRLHKENGISVVEEGGA